ncbi:sugar phosphate isomerase/epimerase family protein [Magnetospira thiophila]
MPVAELARVSELGVRGLEVAPSRIWADTWQGLAASQVSAYRQQVEAAGLRMVGLHSLIFDHPDLGLFKDAETRSHTLDFFTHLSAVCRDLGGKTLIWGGGRRRGDVSLADAFDEAIAFMGELCARIDDHGTVFCFEPLGPKDSDFVNSVHESIRIVETVNHPSLRVQLDAKALMENDEINEATFVAAAPYLVHYHANEQGLGILGEGGAVPHARLGQLLQGIGYDDWVSIEQRMLPDKDPLEILARSIGHVKDCYP